MIDYTLKDTVVNVAVDVVAEVRHTVVLYGIGMGAC
jgi:hypothetical protein